ncbi:MAG: RsmB/NOP family class I SAM-dependent RNA methyltransferase [Candidatus Freyarchaeum deiterrae]
MPNSRELAADMLIQYESNWRSASLRTIFYNTVDAVDIDDIPVKTSSYGLMLETIKCFNTLDYLLIRFINKKRFREMDPFLRNMLRIATLELKFNYDSTVRVEDIVYKLILKRRGENDAKYAMNILEKVNELNFEEALNKLDKNGQISLKYFHPTYLVSKFVEIFGYDEAVELMQANNQKKTVWLRVNTLKSSMEDAIQTLEKGGAGVQRDEDFPEVFRLLETENPVPLTPVFRDRSIIIQDKASVAVVHALDPKPGECVLDACAAPGMKTSLISQKMGNAGLIVAVDNNQARLNKMKELLEISGVKNVEFKLADSRKLSEGEYDKILVDAPCTSSGVIQSSPEMKWRLNQNQVDWYSSIQKDILENTLNLLKKNGTLVFSTCSVFPEEGEQVIDAVKEKVVILKLEVPGSEGYKGYTFSPKIKRFFPHKHGTQGFFMCKMKLKETDNK